MAIFPQTGIRWLGIVLGAAVAQAQPVAVEMPGGWTWHSPPEFRIQTGDDPGWREPEFDDTGWQVILPSQLPARDGIYWLRFKVRVPPATGSAALTDGIVVTLLGACDLFWDGELVGRNGTPAMSRSEEVPGKIDALFQIPATLAGPGEHVVAMRISTHHNRFPSALTGINFRLANFADALVQRGRHAVESLVAFGGLAGLAVAFFLAWLLLDRRPAGLLFAGVALVAAVIQGVQGWRGVSAYAYSWHYPRLLMLTSLVAGLGGLLVAAVGWRFELPRRGMVLALLAGLFALVWAASPSFPAGSRQMFLIGLVVSAGLTAWAWRLGRRHALVLGAGLLVSIAALVGNPREFAERTFLLSFGATLAGAFTSLALGWRDERRAARQAQLTAARLEIELLKKHIQPHFLMNTLTTLMEVVESEPKQAVRMIDALAAEFRILARVSGENLIPLEEEIALCQAHLQIMSLRHAQPCELTVNAVDPAALVPPALFHTLIENSFTHQLAAAGGRRFHLEGARMKAGVRYVFLAPGSAEVLGGAGPRREGTGMKYVKARLEESFPGRWTLHDAATATGWRTVVELRDAP